MCVIHKCDAEKLCVKILRYRKNIGFVKESVIRLKCNVNRDGGSEGSNIDSVHAYLDPLAPDNRD